MLLLSSHFEDQLFPSKVYKKYVRKLLNSARSVRDAHSIRHRITVFCQVAHRSDTIKQCEAYGYGGILRRSSFHKGYGAVFSQMHTTLKNWVSRIQENCETGMLEVVGLAWALKKTDHFEFHGIASDII